MPYPFFDEDSREDEKSAERVQPSVIIEYHTGGGGEEDHPELSTAIKLGT